MNTSIYDANHDTRLGDIADIRSGHPFRGSIEPDVNGDVHVVQVRNTKATGEIIQDEVITTTLISKKQPDWLKTGDILFVAKGAKHYSALVEDLPKQTVCSPHFFLVRIKPAYKELVTPEFICWQLNQLPAQRYFQTTAEGSLYLSVRRQILEYVPITILPIDKQRQITAMHRCAVKEQKVLQQLIENRQQQLDAIAHKALTA
ncbi:restriction endonuclease subunit S [Colwellia sp. 6_MG-2023]|uniref:restriction endonuclease subunit S n=1 Tax=Colwellia sp. 6_MG-2023 TaxID=3062676 RepID=UPI0026E3FEC9|nr:restriction endonuclease subunit S [Colwellia sp. 6_MG-2023]MDO6488046.1 restriction endonuclease subunit S [Colwellia sp. 6_MG-2023]